MELVWLQAGRPFLLFDFFGGEGVLAGRPTDFNGATLDASLETFLTKKRKNKGRGGVLAGRPTDFKGLKGPLWNGIGCKLGDHFYLLTNLEGVGGSR